MIIHPKDAFGVSRSMDHIYKLALILLLGYEVGKPSKILIKISSTMDYIESDIQNFEAPRIDDIII